MLSREIKSEILQAVRAHLRQRLLGEEALLLSENPFYNTQPGIFVTLHKKGDLRGCIGYIEGFQPLKKSLFEMADAAAFRDSRFTPLCAEELDDISIEVSLLSPPEKIQSFRDIEIGKHGIILHKGRHKALFLPQVAPEQGWDLRSTLQHLSMKAGLGPDTYLDSNCEFFVFRAEVFSE